MSPPHVVGFANGLAQSIVSLARFLGPVRLAYLPYVRQLTIFGSTRSSEVISGARALRKTRAATRSASSCARAYAPSPSSSASSSARILRHCRPPASACIRICGLLLQCCASRSVWIRSPSRVSTFVHILKPRRSNCRNMNCAFHANGPSGL